MWADQNYNPRFDKKISLDLNTIEPSLAGPKRPQDKILLREMFLKSLKKYKISQILVLIIN